MLKDLKEILSAKDGGLSSKRVIGCLAWMVMLICFCWATVTNKELPEIGELILITATTLLGVDSVVSPFRKGESKNIEK